jgi:hypothetical protein
MLQPIKILEAMEKNQVAIMSQGMKYLNEENMEEIIISYKFLKSLHMLSKSKYSSQSYDFPKKHQAGMSAVYKWLKCRYKKIRNNDFMDSLVKLEEAMQEEKLICTKVYNVLEAV